MSPVFFRQNNTNTMDTTASVLRASNESPLPPIRQQSYKFNNIFYTENRPWCQKDLIDYCPLVISLMSFIILVSIILIIYLCIKTSLNCRFVHKLSRKMFRQRQSSMQTLNVSSNYINEPPPNVAINEVNQLNVISVSQVPVSPDSRRVWCTNLSKYSRQSAPPTYEESQLMDRIINANVVVRPKCVPSSSSSSTNRIVRTYPRKAASFSSTCSSNEAFSEESLSIANQSAGTSGTSVFPSYRCLALTTRPGAASPVQRLSTLSRQLLQDDETYPTYLSAIDEVPPPYEAVVTTNVALNLENSFNANLSTRLQNFSIRSREFCV